MSDKPKVADVHILMEGRPVTPAQLLAQLYTAAQNDELIEVIAFTVSKDKSINVVYSDCKPSDLTLAAAFLQQRALQWCNE